MHQFYRTYNMKELQRLCFRSEQFPEQVISVQEATEALVGNRVDYRRCASSPARRGRAAP
jgi:ornithine decarboxylase